MTLEKRFISRPEIKTYFQKSQIINEPIIKPEFQGLKLEDTISKMFIEGFNFVLEDLKKTRTFYEFILVDTKSAEITHVPYKKDQSRITHWN